METGGRPDYLQKLKVPEGYEKIIDYSNMGHGTADGLKLQRGASRGRCAPPRTRSRLYRSQILQVNIRWKALYEIYKICMFLHRSDLNISANFHQIFLAFSKLDMLKSSIFVKFRRDFR